MKAFLVKISLFASLLLFCAYTLDFGITKGLKQVRRGYYGVWNDIFNSNIHADVIINGSSRALVHYNTEILDSILQVYSYNLGENGYGFNTQNIRYRLFEKYNCQPWLIIQNVDFITLGQFEDGFKTQLLHYSNEPTVKKELKKKGVLDIDFYLPALRYNCEWKKIMLGIMEITQIKYASNDRYKGYGGIEKKWDGSGLLKRETSGDSIVACYEPEIVTLFDTFISNCKQNNTQVIMVFSPLYYKAWDFTKDKGKVLDIFRSFSEKYNIPFLDYSHDPICYDTIYFYNVNHLNKKGAELFSLKLANDIKEQKLFQR